MIGFCLHCIMQNVLNSNVTKAWPGMQLLCRLLFIKHTMFRSFLSCCLCGVFAIFLQKRAASRNKKTLVLRCPLKKHSIDTPHANRNSQMRPYFSSGNMEPAGIVLDAVVVIAIIVMMAADSCCFCAGWCSVLCNAHSTCTCCVQWQCWADLRSKCACWLTNNKRCERVGCSTTLSLPHAEQKAKSKENNRQHFFSLPRVFCLFEKIHCKDLLGTQQSIKQIVRWSLQNCWSDERTSKLGCIQSQQRECLSPKDGTGEQHQKQLEQTLSLTQAMTTVWPTDDRCGRHINIAWACLKHQPRGNLRLFDTNDLPITKLEDWLS